MTTWSDVQRALGGGEPIVPAGVPRAQVPDGIAAVVTTSGSTGPGKQVMLSRSALLASAEATQQVVGPATWTCALPTQYVAGLMTLVRSFAAGLPPRFASADLRDLDPAPGRNAISLVGTQLVRALGDPDTLAALQRYDIVLVGGSAVPDAVIHTGRSAGLNLTLTYGMSETCGGCVYDGVPLPGVRVEVRPETTAPEGRLWITGPTLFSGYLGDADATASALQGGWLRTSDRGRWSAGVLQVLGRDDDVVISGGVNVDLAHVQAALDHEPVRAAVVAVPDAEWGVRIVLVAEPGRDLAEWRAALGDRLKPAALPRQLVVVDTLPASDRGKLDRAALLRIVEGGNGGVARTMD